MYPDTIGYVWTGEYDLNTLRVDGEIFESATKKLRIRKYPYTCGQGLSMPWLQVNINLETGQRFLKVYPLGDIIERPRPEQERPLGFLAISV